MGEGDFNPPWPPWGGALPPLHFLSPVIFRGLWKSWLFLFGGTGMIKLLQLDLTASYRGGTSWALPCGGLHFPLPFPTPYYLWRPVEVTGFVSGGNDQTTPTELDELLIMGLAPPWIPKGGLTPLVTLFLLPCTSTTLQYISHYWLCQDGPVASAR